MIESFLRRAYYGWRAQRNRYRPPLEPLALPNHLTALSQGASKSSSAKTPSPAATLPSLFRQRSGAKDFFASPARFTRLVEQNLQERPHWVKRTLERANRDTEHGLDVYCRRVEPMSAQFPWGSIAPGVGEDAVYTYRPHRFAFAPQLALASWYDPVMTSRLNGILAAWVRFAQQDRAEVAYATKLVVTQRFLSLSWVWSCLSAKPADRLSDVDWENEALLLRILFSDARFLLRTMGQEFPNNHLLADWFIGWYIEFLFPEFLAPGESERDHENGWLVELERQIHTDGSSFEHSVHYHEFATELVCAYLLLQRRNGLKVADWVQDRAHRMLRLQADIHGNQGEPLALGDTTEDPVFPLDVGGAWSIGGNRELLRALFEPDLAPAPPGDPSVERAFWLLGGELCAPSDHTAEASRLSAYHQGGFYVLRDARHELIFRTGPAPGVPVCAGHMPANLLSVHLRVDDVCVVTDSGTGTYLLGTPKSEPAWRRYFLGPDSHNSLTIADHDPLEPITRSYRSSDLNCRVHLGKYAHRPDLSWIEGTVHSGNAYNGYTRGVIQIPGDYWIIYDDYPSTALQGNAWAAFQFPSGSEIAGALSSTVRAEFAGKRVWLSTSDGRSTSVLTGSRSPLGGWVSRGYGRFSPAPQLRYRVDRRHGAWVVCGQSEEGSAPGPPYQLVDLQTAEPALALKVVGSDVVDMLLVRTSPDIPNSSASVWGIDFDGELLHLRAFASGALSLRLVNATRVRAPSYELNLSVAARPADLIVDDTGGKPRILLGQAGEWGKLIWRGQRPHPS